MEEKQETQKKKLGTGGKIAIGCGAITLLGIIIFVIITVVGIAGLGKVIEDVDKQQQERETAEEDAFNNPSSIGESVIVGDIEWFVVGARDLGNTLKSTYGDWGEDCVAKSGTFIEVDLKVKNNGTGMVSLTDLYLYDSEKREFVTSSDVFSCVEGNLFILDNINPGIELSYIAVYEVPEESEGFRLKVGNLDFLKSGHEYISLGF